MPEAVEMSKAVEMLAAVEVPESVGLPEAMEVLEPVLALGADAGPDGSPDAGPDAGSDTGRVETVGGKAASLRRLIAFGVNVPPAFVIPADWYRSQLLRVLASPQATTPESVAAALRRLPLTPPMRAALAQAVRQAGLPAPWAVRSSGVGEDGQSHSFAGQFDTVLGVAGLDALDDALRQVWASAWSAHGLAYAQARGLAPVAMAVIVQQQVDAAWSGVLFTRDPRLRTEPAAVSGVPAGGLVEMVPGLGDALVAGVAEPWRFRFAAQGGAVLESRPAEEGAAAENPGDAPWLAELIETARRIERQRGQPQDIEWSVDAQGRLWWLQARPVTTLAAVSATVGGVGSGGVGPGIGIGAGGSGSGEREWWSNANVAENFPDPLTPFLFSIVRRGYAAYFRNLGLGFGISPARIAAMAPRLERLVGLHGGRLYYNLSNIHAVLAQAPRGRQLAAWFNTFTGAQEFPAVATVEIGLLARCLEPLRIVAATAARYLRIEQHVRRFEGTVDAYAASTTAQALAAASPRELAQRIAAFLQIRTERWNDAALADAAAMVTYGLLSRSIAAPPLSDGASRLHALLKGLPDLVSAQPVERLWELACAVRDDPVLAKRLAEEEPAALAADWQAGRLGDFGRRFGEYLHTWGFRYSRELMLDSPTPDEDPAPMFALLKTYLRADGHDPAVIAQAQARDRVAVTYDTLRRLSPNALWRALPFSRAGRLRWLLRATQASIRYRERARMKQALLYTRLRKVVREAGARLQAAGWIDAVDDAFMVVPETLIDLLQRLGDASDGRTAAQAPTRAERLAIAVARLLHRQYAAQQPPDTLRLPHGLAWTPGLRAAVNEASGLAGGDVDSMGDAGRDADAAADTGTGTGTAAGTGAQTFRGTPACGGKAAGPGIVVTDVSGIHAIEPGQILVTRQTDPGWATVFFLVSGLVIERGGMLSHGAIIAREYGIPAVIGITQASTRIRSGQWLIVDGDQGTVDAHDR